MITTMSRIRGNNILNVIESLSDDYNFSCCVMYGIWLSMIGISGRLGM